MIEVRATRGRRPQPPRHAHRATGGVQNCPACGSVRLARYPRSAATGHVNFRCRDCGLAGWADRDQSTPEPVAIEQIGVDAREQWLATKRVGLVDRAWDQVLDRIESGLGGAAGHRLYDVGAGDGQFLSVARERGFEVRGNDLMQAAVQIARTQYDVDLDLGDLGALGIEQRYDAVTLWCVLAHVPVPQNLLTGAFAALRPGGVMYLQTPYRCVPDTVGLAALGASRGHASRWVDRRLAGHHWILHTKRSMAAALDRAGFTEVEIRPVPRYTLQSGTYLTSLGIGERAATAAGKALDGLIDRGFAPRIVLDVFARRPA